MHRVIPEVCHTRAWPTATQRRLRDAGPGRHASGPRPDNRESRHTVARAAAGPIAVVNRAGPPPMRMVSWKSPRSTTSRDIDDGAPHGAGRRDSVEAGLYKLEDGSGKAVMFDHGGEAVTRVVF